MADFLGKANEIGKGHDMDDGRGNGQKEINNQMLLYRQGRRAQVREEKLRQYGANALTSKELIRRIDKKLKPEGDALIVPMTYFDRVANQTMKHTAQQMNLKSISEANFRNRKSKLSQYTNVGY